MPQTEEETSSNARLERPLTNGFAPYALSSEYLRLIPLFPAHQDKLYAEIFSQAHIMKYLGAGHCFTHEEYAPIHLWRAHQNLYPPYEASGHISEFTWTLLTHNGIAGRFNIYPEEERTDLAFCICPSQQGRSLARRASELVVGHLGEDTPFIATAHPENIASAKSLEQIRYPDGRYVFFGDTNRQNTLSNFGEDQPRDYFVSKRPVCSFFSFYQGKNIIVDASNEPETLKSNCIS